MLFDCSSFPLGIVSCVCVCVLWLFDVMDVCIFSTQTLLSLPEVVKNCDQLQQLVEYIG